MHLFVWQNLVSDALDGNQSCLAEMLTFNNHRIPCLHAGEEPQALLCGQGHVAPLARQLPHLVRPEGARTEVQSAVAHARV